MTNRLRGRLANDTRLAALLTDALRQVARDVAELDEMTPQEWDALKREAEHGRAMRRGRQSLVSDDELEAAMHAVEHQYSGLKRREQYRRVGIPFGLSWSQVQARLLRLRRK